MPRDKNQAIYDLVKMRSEAVSPEEWREALRQFKAFTYSKSEAWLQDFEIIVGVGLRVFHRLQDWAKFDGLIKWALAQKQDRNRGTWFTHLIWSRSLALIARGDITRSLRMFLTDMKTLRRESTRRTAFIMGVNVFIHLGPDRGSPDEVAPEHVINFARKLVEIHYPYRKVPVVLRKDRKKKEVTFAEVHRALSSF